MIIEHPTEELEKVDKVDKVDKVEKVRGMNASLSTTSEGSLGPLSERTPGRVHITRRQIVFGAVLAVLAAIAAILTVRSIGAADASFPAVVTTSKTYDLNFADSAKVTAVNVKVGQYVTAGQVLATQDTASLESQRTDEEGVVQADKQALAQAGAPSLTPGQRQQDSLAAAQAQTALTNAQANLTATQGTASANVTAAQTTLTTAESQANSDLSLYTQACPNGPIPPTAAGQTAAQQAYTHCQTLQQTDSQDLSAVTQAKAQISVVQAQSQQSIDTAQATVNSDQSALNTANYQAALQTSPGSVSAQAQALANLNQAQTQLAAIQQQLAGATLTAPDGGVVSEVFGAPGEVVGPTGVQQYRAPAALPTNHASGFSLFPSQPTAQGASTSSGGSEPVIEVIGGRQQVLSQVPEATISRTPVGKTVSVYFTALNRTESGVVTQVGVSPTRDNTAVTYNVTVTLSRAVPGLLPGMSATVKA
jgi:multidrug efflux pump subunit AcrA (membrane-fusion protein)